MRKWTLLVVRFWIFWLTAHLALHAQDFQLTTVTGSAKVGATPATYGTAVASKSHPLGWWAKTESGASLVVTFSPQNIFRLLPASEVQVLGEGATSTGFRRVLKLNAGQIKLDLGALPAKSQIEVETPSAICGAVGTVFTVDAGKNFFQVNEGSVFASSRVDQGFVAQKVQGSFTLSTGQENSFNDLDVTGSYRINGTSTKGPAKIRLAKAKGGTGSAAIELLGGSFAGRSSGSYIMQNGQLEPTPADLLKVQSDYLQAAAREGDLNVRKLSLQATRQGVPDRLQSELDSATKRATELRKMLFARRLIRETVQDISRQTARPRP
jgi:hypothetical protein